ncbi:ileal sodium/bile acid cotransporter-like [Littorina saxatilis]|uniref:Ileal sodium/bile acid cotransporter n=1 Tax=Littorina saxatilis TaxID=31220 RepID=A0AAN9BGN8_9CAEN
MKHSCSVLILWVLLTLAFIQKASLNEISDNSNLNSPDNQFFPKHRAARESRDRKTFSDSASDHEAREKTGDGGGGVTSPGNRTESRSIMDITMESTTPNTPFPVPPGVVVMFMDSERVFNPDFTLRCPHLNARYLLSVTLEQISHSNVAHLSSPVALNLSCEHAVWNDTAGDGGGEFILSGDFNVTISSDLLGKGLLMFMLQTQHENGPSVGNSSEPRSEYLVNSDASSTGVSDASISLASSNSHSSSQTNSSALPTVVHKTAVLVLKPLRAIDIAFRVTMFAILIVTTVAMGCKTDFKVVKEVLKKPAAPIIGFCCQYICMPLIAYGVARSLKLDNQLMSFGIFACGVCPGGGASNMYSYLLGGDLSLSVTLTIISTVASLGMIPLWLFTLGATMDTGEMKINIPYLEIVKTLAIVILPIFVGFFLQYFFPKVVKVMMKAVKPVVVIALIFMLTVGIYANLYIFRLFQPMTILAGCMLPYIGYIVGGTVALICRQPWPRVKTIALETGIQNVGVAFLILIFSLPPPDGELAAVGPAASGFMTGMPPFFVTLAYLAYNKVKGKPSPGQRDKDLKKAMLEKELSKEIVVGDSKKNSGVRLDCANGTAETVKLTETESSNEDV